MRSAILLSLVSLSGICLLTSGYGCGSTNGGSAGDGGTGNETSSGSSGGSSGGIPGDASGDSPDGAQPCTAMPAGNKVLATTTQSVLGVTGDNQVVIYDPTAKSLSAVPLAGGTATSIGPFDNQQDYVAIAGNIVVLAQGGSQSNPAGTLTLWTSAGGAKKVGSATYGGYPGSGALDVSSDGKYVLYTENATATTADIYVAGTDGSSPTKLVGGTSVGNACAPILYFAGDDAVVSYCTAQPDPDASTMNVATVAAITGAPNWQTTQTFANGDAANFVVARAGASASQVAFVTSAGLQVEAIGGTTPTTIDANGVSGMFNHAGTSVIYQDASGNVWTSPVAAAAPAELVGASVAQTLALSSDDKWLEVAENFSHGNTDMYLVSTTASGADGGNALTTLDGMTDGANFGDAFTADNSHALFFTGINSNATGSYMSLGLPPSGAAKAITMTGWVGYATSAAKVVYSDNWSMAGAFEGHADIHAVDLSGTAAPTTLVSAADASFYVTADKSKVVYSWHGCPGAAEGIYSIAAP